MTTELTQLREANSTRVKRWHGPDSEPWTGSDWSNAMCGEAGETANVVKKLRRHETRAVNEGDPPYEALLSDLGDEIADTIIYLDLLALHYGIELWPAIVAKFNRTSAKYGFSEALAAVSVGDAPGMATELTGQNLRDRGVREPGGVSDGPQ